MDLLAQLRADGLLDEDDEASGEAGGLAGRRTVVLLGVTGDGKSSTGNTLSGSKAFAVSDSFKSETQDCAHADYQLGSGSKITSWRVVDTIGLHDTDLPQQEVINRFITFADRARDGIDAFLFVVRWGRFKPEHDAALSSFVSNCGEAALRHTMLVFTHCKESPDEVQRALAEHAPSTLQGWLPRLQAAVGIENELSPDVSRERLHEALELLFTQNGGERYSNEALAEAREKALDAEEAERAAFQAAVADWRKGSGPVVVERESGVITRPGAASSQDG